MNLKDWHEWGDTRKWSEKFTERDWKLLEDQVRVESNYYYRRLIENRKGHESIQPDPVKSVAGLRLRYVTAWKPKYHRLRNSGMSCYEAESLLTGQDPDEIRLLKSFTHAFSVRAQAAGIKPTWPSVRKGRAEYRRLRLKGLSWSEAQGEMTGKDPAAILQKDRARARRKWHEEEAPRYRRLRNQGKSGLEAMAILRRTTPEILKQRRRERTRKQAAS